MYLYYAFSLIMNVSEVLLGPPLYETLELYTLYMICEIEDGKSV